MSSLFRILVFGSLIGLTMRATAAQERTDKVLLQGNAAGSQIVQTESLTSARAEYSYNDRGRGDHIIATWKVDASGVPVEYDGHGNDYMKAGVEEHFSVTDGKAVWKNRSEHGEQPLNRPTFYLPANAPPEFTAVLARALLKAPDHKLPLLPAGEAALQETRKTKGTNETQLTCYRIDGLGFQPEFVWLAPGGDMAALLDEWLAVVAPADQNVLAEMRSLQDAARGDWAADIARKTVRVPKGDVVITNARLFDPRDLTVTPGATVVLRGQRIIRVGAGSDVNRDIGAEVIDARGGFLMPGLWDNHQHFGSVDGALDLACGVTDARDMANNTDAFLERVARFDSGTELGPHVLKAGIIDGTGQFAGPTKMRVDTPQQATDDVDWYADHGYAQIKIYSSVKPELVPVIADRAHSKGLRVSGHVPAFMSARQFIEDGADEIQHLNFIELNFLFPEVKETRNRDRFIKVAERAREFTPDKPQVREFIEFLKKHHTVLDPTMNVFEGLFCGDPTRAAPGTAAAADRFPPQVMRSLLSGALEIPKGKEDAYRAAFPAMLELLKAIHDAGITIIPGTDSLAGYTFHHELELYARSGIPAAEVLRMATLTSAEVMGVDKDRGVIAPGKIANMVLIEGDPIKNISDVRRVVTVFKDGKICDPAAIEKALGIAPRSQTQ
ncbi:MAG: amidohydrolase family protein [Chthoniobacterales bacterium]